MKNTPLSKIMVSKVITADENDSLSSVEEKFRLYRIRHIPVINETRKVVGIFTHRDLARCLTPRKTEEGYFFDKLQMDSFILKHVMTRDPMVLTPQDTLDHVLEIMVRDKYGCVPIVDERGVLAGIVTQIDVLKFIRRSFLEDLL